MIVVGGARDKYLPYRHAWSVTAVWVSFIEPTGQIVERVQIILRDAKYLEKNFLGRERLLSIYRILQYIGSELFG